MKYLKKHIKLFCLLILFIPVGLYAQNDPLVTTININVNVENQLKIEATSNIEIVINSDTHNILKIDPITSDVAGSFIAVGSPFSSLKITFPQVITLKKQGSANAIQFHIKVASLGKNEKKNSRLISNNETNLMLNDKGRRYFWIGGDVKIKNLPKGVYVGTISLNIVYD